MTLFRQLITAILALFLVLYSINIFVSLNNSRILVEDQMRVHAQDTATSLGLSMTQAAVEKDSATLDTLFNAVSDSGFFQRIYFSNLDGDVIIDRNFPISIESVPNWFVRWAEFPAFEGKAQVADGWAQLGELTVISHPGQAYLRLWKITTSQFLWFALVTFVACLLAYSALRWLLTPLRAVESQANAVSQGSFEIQELVPKTRELKSVVEAMNRMSVKLKKLFMDQMDLIVKLRKQSSTDPVTGLPNRADFDARLESHVGMETGPHTGILMIISVADLTEINRLSGRLAANDILKTITERLYTELEAYPKSIIARRQGVEFSVFVPDVDGVENHKLAQQVFDSLTGITWQHQDKCPLVFHMGYTYQDQVEDIRELLSAADMSLKKAQSLAKNTLQDYASLDEGDAPVLSKTADDWQGFIQQIIKDKNINLYYQPVMQVSDKKVLANEVYVRFPQGDNLFSAGTLLPIVERLGLMPEVDKLIFEQLAMLYEAGDNNAAIRLNLSPYTLCSENFCEWLDAFLSRNKKFAANLIVEMAEYAVRVNKQLALTLNQLLTQHQAGFCIDHFGLETASFSYLGSLKLHSLKVHRSFVKNLEDNSDNQFYIKALAKLAHNMDVQLYVEGVETQAQWDILCQLGIDACQGYHLGKPTDSPVSS